MTIPEIAPRNTTLTSWVDSYAATTHVIPTDGRARKSLSRYGCTLEHNTMQGYTINAVKDATDWVNRVWIVRMQKEWLTVSKSGVGLRWIGQDTQVKVKVLIKELCARDARMVIALNCELEPLTDKASKFFTSSGG